MAKYQIFVSDEHTHGEEGDWAVAVAPYGEDEGWDVSPDMVFDTVPEFLEATADAIESGGLTTMCLSIDKKFRNVVNWNKIIRQLRQHIEVTLD